MADALAGPGADAAANRGLWTKVNAEYADEHAFRACHELYAPPGAASRPAKLPSLPQATQSHPNRHNGTGRECLTGLRPNPTRHARAG